ncbi:MAG TPA: efflux RND transporter periplasmic adaptor subunit [Longimicrobiales bacterium]|nr:efflux RND transporter periplasmic adaptor subunit [Longimicrobiales bacterium]
MTMPFRARWLALALVAVVVAAGIWTLTSRDAPQQAAAQSALAQADDPHAGHDMSAVEVNDGVVVMDPAMASSLGVVVVEAQLAPVARAIRTTGSVTYDETRLTTITPKFSGFAERLHVNFTGQPVRRGQALLEVYSPELVAAQEELLSALRMTAQLRASASPAVIERTAGLVDAARRRLLLWDISPAQVRQVEESGEVRRTLTMHAPSSGFVTEKMVQEGQAIGMGMPLYRLADLSTVWIEADVYEQDLRFVAVGEKVQVEITAYPQEPFSGRVSYIHPDVRAETRTTRVRIEMTNPGGRIKPGMYATVSIDAPVTQRAVVVPRDAVMHSGTHAMVFIEEAPGTYRIREVTVGVDAGGQTQILSGLLAGERVVSRANFLIDSESRLTESMGDMPGMNH